MAWISSEYFYRRLIRSQMHNTEQLEQQESVLSEAMQKHVDALTDERDALIEERDELVKWKEAHSCERKDSATCDRCEDCEKSHAENLILTNDFATSRAECSRLQSENEELRTSLLSMEDEACEMKSLRRSFDELQALHEQLKKSNDDLERNLAVISRDLVYQSQASEELERSRDDLQDQVDEVTLELNARKKTISSLMLDITSKDNKITTISSQLESAWAEISELVQSRKDLESQLDESREELLLLAALSEQEEDYKRNFEKLQGEHELVRNKFQELKEAVSASKVENTKVVFKPWDGFNDGFLVVMMIISLFLGLYGMGAGHLT